MSYQNMQSNYLANQVMQASPKRLVELLMEGCIKNLKQANLAADGKEEPYWVCSNFCWLFLDYVAKIKVGYLYLALMVRISMFKEN